MQKLTETGTMKLPEARPSHRRYYMPSEVAQHNTPEDCWLSWFGEIYDLSPVLEQHCGRKVSSEDDVWCRHRHEAICGQRRPGYHSLVRSRDSKCESVSQFWLSWCSCDSVMGKTCSSYRSRLSGRFFTSLHPNPGPTGPTISRLLGGRTRSSRLHCSLRSSAYLGSSIRSLIRNI